MFPEEGKKKVEDDANSTGRLLLVCRHSLSARKTRCSTFTAETHPGAGGGEVGWVRAA